MKIKILKQIPVQPLQFRPTVGKVYDAIKDKFNPFIVFINVGGTRVAVFTDNGECEVIEDD